MLVGTVAGGVVAQATSLGVPYVLRAVALALTFAVAFVAMHDVGFAPARGASVVEKVRGVLRASIAHGLRNPPVRWVMLAGLIGGGVPIFGFYAMQPYLLELSGRSGSYAIAGASAAIVALAQFAGAWLVPLAGRAFRRRTSALVFTSLSRAASLVGIGVSRQFWTVLALLTAWAVAFAATFPVRQAFLNGLVPSAQRATVLSFDNLLVSAGGVVAQPALGRAADAWGWAASYLAGAAVELLAVPFLALARRERAPADRTGADGAPRG
jgi:MFS family permease